MTDRHSEDADILVSHEELVTLYNAMSRRQGGFRVDVDEITWSKRNHLGNHEFFVRVELIQLNGPFAPRIPSIVGFGDGWVATLPELGGLGVKHLLQGVMRWTTMTSGVSFQ